MGGLRRYHICDELAEILGCYNEVTFDDFMTALALYSCKNGDQELVMDGHALNLDELYKLKPYFNVQWLKREQVEKYLLGKQVYH